MNEKEMKQQIENELEEMIAEGIVCREGDTIQLTQKIIDDAKKQLADSHIFLTGMLHKLRDAGIMSSEGDVDALTENGVARFEELKASGYVPTDAIALEILSDVCGDSEAAQQVWAVMKDQLADEQGRIIPIRGGE